MISYSSLKPPSRRALIALALLCSVLNGCATSPGRTTNDDPLIGFNRGVYKFNDGLDRTVLKPTATGYKKITPSWLRTGIGNVFSNVAYPITMVNQLLQGKPKMFARDTARFVTNTVFGIGGIFDVADKVRLHANDEDFGQTLATWGVPSGPYLMLPLLGPSTARDAPGKVVDYFISPMRNVDAEPAVEWGAKALEIIDDRASLLSSEATLDSAYDKYGVMRDAWTQRREYQVFDGDPPEEKIEEFEEFEDDPPAER